MVNIYRLTARTQVRNRYFIHYVTDTHEIPERVKIEVTHFAAAVVLSVAVIHCYGEGHHQVRTETIDPNPKGLIFYVHNICYGPHTLISTAALHSTGDAMG